MRWRTGGKAGFQLRETVTRETQEWWHFRVRKRKRDSRSTQWLAGSGSAAPVQRAEEKNDKDFKKFKLHFRADKQLEQRGDFNTAWLKSTPAIPGISLWIL